MQRSGEQSLFFKSEEEEMVLGGSLLLFVPISPVCCDFHHVALMFFCKMKSSWEEGPEPGAEDTWPIESSSWLGKNPNAAKAT